MSKRAKLTSSGRSYVVDFDAKHIHRPDDKVIELTPQQCALLQHLIVNRSRIVTRDDLRDNVWKREHVGTETIDEAIRRLRSALDDTTSKTSKADFIRTRRGFGYMLECDVELLESTQTLGPVITYDAHCTVNQQSLKAAIAALPTIPKIAFHKSVVEARALITDWCLEFDSRIEQFTAQRDHIAKWTPSEITYLRAEVLARSRAIDEEVDGLSALLSILISESTETSDENRGAAIEMFLALAALSVVSRLRSAITYIYQSQDGPITGNEFIRQIPFGPRLIKEPYAFRDVPEVSAFFFAITPEENSLPKLLFPQSSLFNYSLSFVRCRVGEDHYSDFRRYAIPNFIARREAERPYSTRRCGMTDTTFYHWILPQSLILYKIIPEPDARTILVFEDKAGLDIDP